MKLAHVAASALMAGLFFNAAPAMAQANPAANPVDEAAALREQVRILEARLDALERRLTESTSPQAIAAATAAAGITPAAAPAPVVASAPTTKIEWKGSPRFVEGDKAFKVKGRIQADAGYVSAPGSLNDRGLGFNSEMRRIRLGGEGQLGAGFGYKLELELSDNNVDLVDTFVTYEKGGWLIRLGNHNGFQSLDELTGDTTGSVMERAAFTDAFNFERRLGLSAQYSKGPLLAQAGVFTDDIGSLANSNDGVNGGDENNSYSIDGRLVYAPKLGDTQLHFGASAHWRRLGRLEDASTRYRQRPFLHTTNTRLIGTPGMNVDNEFNYGVEFAAISGPWHAAAEYHALRASRVGLSSVQFSGAYAELGYFLTKDDTRAYKEGQFAGGKPAHPMGKDGMGSVQINLRYDYLDLDSKDIRGGQQNAAIAALIWSPIQNLRFNVNYAWLMYDGATALPSGDQDYDAQVLGTRFELDF
jgi:phosphate-selective porin OprO/OprP